MSDADKFPEDEGPEGKWAGKSFEEPSIQSLVAADILEREQYGIGQYGEAIFASRTPNDPTEGGPIGQGYREILDLAIYLKWYQMRHGTSAAFAFGALQAIEAGEWDRHLTQLARAISARQKQINK